MDTATWTIKTDSAQTKWNREERIKEDPKASIPKPEENKKTVKKKDYKVALLMPLFVNHDPDKSEHLLRMRHFVFGARLASQQFKPQNCNIEIQVFDVESTKNRFGRLIAKDSLKDFDAFVGPFKTQDIRDLLNYIGDKPQWVFSPWNTNNQLLETPSNYVQLKPGIEAHFYHIARDIAEKYPNARTFVVCEKDDLREQGYFELFQKAVAFKNNKLLSNRLELLLLDGKKGTLDSIALKKAYDEHLHNVYILPYWSDHQFIVKFLQVMGQYIAEKSNVTLYGLPQWLQFPQISMDMYERYNIRVSAHAYYDTSRDRESKFRKWFFDIYGTIPFEDAYYGFDIFTWLLQFIDLYGLDREQMSNVFIEGLFHPLDLRPYRRRGEPISDRFEQKYGFENYYTQMIMLENYRFVSVD